MSDLAGTTPDNNRLSWLLTLCVSALVVVMVVPDGFDYASLAKDTPSTGSLFSQTIWLSLLGCGVLMTMTRLSKARVLTKTTNRYLLLFVLLAAASILWSIDSGVTFKRVFRITIILFVACACQLYGWRANGFQFRLLPILTLLMIGSIAFVYANPKMGVEQLDQAELVGAWRGLTTQKNMLGALSAVCTLLWLHAFLTRQGNRLISLGGMGLAVFCLVNSRSSTSLMATIMASMFMLLLLSYPPSLRRYMPYVVGIFVSIILIYSLAVLHLVPGLDFVLKPITTFTGKDLTFSGRTAIWDIVNERIAQHKLLGCGYGAYWVGAVVSSDSYEMVRRLYFYPTEAHNGYLDVINDLGMIGGACLFAYLIVYLRQSLELLKYNRAQAALYLTLLLEQLIGNLSESMWLNVRSVEFVVMTLATVSLGYTVYRERQRIAGVALAAAQAAAQAQMAPVAAAAPGYRNWTDYKRQRR